MCEEKVTGIRSQTINEGSPPRVRGKVRQHLESRQSVGITPACAGKRARPSPCRSQSRDHPRACGEKRVGSLASVGLSGSPPRVRGKACRCPPLDTNQRITPARAEKSGSLRVVPLRSTGSPPRVRGKGGFGFPVGLSLGITPAYAGKSGAPTWATAATGDHPRVCGEKRSGSCRILTRSGSPPHVRGKVHRSNFPF